MLKKSVKVNWFLCGGAELRHYLYRIKIKIMKIEFIKETKADGGAYYFTQVDNRFVDKSLSYDMDKARIIYDNIVKNKGKIDLREVLDTVDIAELTDNDELPF